MHHLSRGVLIAIEGIDGSGKSTLAKNLSTLLQDTIPVLLTQEPGGSALGMLMRTILHEKRVPICAKAEYLLFATARAQHFQEVVIPALTAKKLVISDRMGDSSLAYQGYGRGLEVAMLQTINQWAMNAITPDLVLYLKISPDIAIERLHQRKITLTSFEQERADFTKKVIHGFDTMAHNNNRWLELDGTQSPTAIAQQAYKKLMHWLTTNNLLE